MRLLVSILLCFSLCSFPCFAQETGYGQPVVQPEILQKDFTAWWDYQYWKINLARDDYQALDYTGKPISKTEFLEELSIGNAIPVELAATGEKVYYQLFALGPEAHSSIPKTMSSLALKCLNRYDLEGQDFPEFSITDLNGQSYDKENTKGKILVIKTWFIGCRACIAEFPALNELVSNQKDRTDILFISLAPDSPERLSNYLQKKPLAYANSGYQRPLLDQLGITEYPTHIIVGPDGKIKKVVNQAHQLIELLEAML